MENLRNDTANFVVREKYLGAIEAFIDQPLVKVLKGMRRVGKSVIMRLLIERLIESGVPGANILYINKESLEFDAVKDYRDLYRYAGNYFKDGAAATAARASAATTTSASDATAAGRKYILIDEIQEIEGWERHINGLLENIVFKELQARGYKMSIGVIDQMEIDFIAEKQNEKKYIQVCYSLGSEAAVEREFGNLEKIKDNYEKVVISMDRFFPAERNGILHRHIIDFLLE